MHTVHAGEIAGQFAIDPQARLCAQEALRLARLINAPWNIAWSLSAAAFFRKQNLDQTAAMLESGRPLCLPPQYHRSGCKISLPVDPIPFL